MIPSLHITGTVINFDIIFEDDVFLGHIVIMFYCMAGSNKVLALDLIIDGSYLLNLKTAIRAQPTDQMNSG